MALGTRPGRNSLVRPGDHSVGSATLWLRVVRSPSVGLAAVAPDFVQRIGPRSSLELHVVLVDRYLVFASRTDVPLSPPHSRWLIPVGEPFVPPPLINLLLPV